jgi:hypothetical protein
MTPEYSLMSDVWCLMSSVDDRHADVQLVLCLTMCFTREEEPQGRRRANHSAGCSEMCGCIMRDYGSRGVDSVRV